LIGFLNGKEDLIVDRGAENHIIANFRGRPSARGRVFVALRCILVPDFEVEG
jgi:hypothetical protein